MAITQDTLTVYAFHGSPNAVRQAMQALPLQQLGGGGRNTLPASETAPAISSAGAPEATNGGTAPRRATRTTNRRRGVRPRKANGSGADTQQPQA